MCRDRNSHHRYSLRTSKHSNCVRNRVGFLNIIDIIDNDVEDDDHRVKDDTVGGTDDK